MTVGHCTLRYTLWMHLKQTECIVNCRMHLIAKGILEWGRKARRLFVKVLENFWNLQIHKNHKESQLRIILLSKNKRQNSIGCDFFNGICSVLFSSIGIKPHFTKYCTLPFFFFVIYYFQVTHFSMLERNKTKLL